MIRIQYPCLPEQSASKKKKLEEEIPLLSKISSKITIGIEDQIHNIGPIHDCIMEKESKDFSGKTLTVASGHKKLGFITSLYVNYL